MLATAFIASLGYSQRAQMTQTTPSGFRGGLTPPVRPSAAVPPMRGEHEDEAMMERLRSILLVGQQSTAEKKPVQSFGATFAPDTEVAESEPAATKAKAKPEAKSETKPKAKPKLKANPKPKAKAEAKTEVEAESKGEDNSQVGTGDLSGMTYKELQAECKRRGLKAVGKKDVLIARLQEAA